MQLKTLKQCNGKYLKYRVYCTVDGFCSCIINPKNVGFYVFHLQCFLRSGIKVLHQSGVSELKHREQACGVSFKYTRNVM